MPSFADPERRSSGIIRKQTLTIDPPHRCQPGTTPLQTNTGTSIRPAIVLAALGIVFGDIGTSPIYTVQTVFNPSDPHPVPLNDHNVYGIVSLIFWSIMLIVTLTYVTLVMRADNDGEGGIMALITLLRRWGSETDIAPRCSWPGWASSGPPCSSATA